MSGFSLLVPAAAVALIALPLIVLFHMRHSTPLRKEVPSLRFWQSAALVQSDDPRFRIPPLTVPLVLQLIAAGAIGLALAQPVLSGSLGGFTQSTEPVHLIMLIDGSTSMAARDTPDESSRFDLAMSDADARLGELRQGDSATVMLLGSQTATYGASDLGELKSLREQLALVQPPGGLADLNVALSLAADLELPNVREEIELYSDGAVTADPSIVANLPGPMRWNAYGRASTPNLAITEIVPRSSTTIPGATDLYLQIANFSDNPADSVLLVQADGIEIERQSITVLPSAPLDVTIRSVPNGTGQIVAEVQSSDPHFADNQARLMFDDRGDAELSVLLVTDLPGASQRALVSISGTSVQTVSSSDFDSNAVSASAFDLVFFDGVLPSSGQVPDRPVVYIDPPRGGLLPDQGMITIPTVETIQTDDPIMAGVDLSGATFRETPAFVLDALGESIVGSAEGSLIFRGVSPESGQPMIVIAFDLAQSNLSSRIAFPILMANIVDSLSPNTLPPTVPLGEPLTFVPRSQTASVTVTDPLDHDTEFSLETEANVSSLASTSRDIVYTATGLPGDYTVVERTADGRTVSATRFSVNAGHPQESRLVANPDLGSTVAAASVNEGGSQGQRLNDLWPLLVAVAVGALVLEWLWSALPSLWKRRITRPPSEVGP